MKKHIITTLFTTVIGCTTAFAQTDGEIGSNGDEGASSGTILSYLKEADIDYVGDGLIGHKLDIYYPDDGKETHNVIIHIYGSAWRSNNSKGSADLGTVGLAALKAGYIFVTPNHRSLNDALWPAQINDIKAVVRYLRGNKKDLKIDDSFIAISGYSSGGHLASMMGVTNGETVVKVGSEPIDIEGALGNFRDESSRVDAVCDWSGPVDSRDKTCGNPINISPENEILGDCTPQECPDKHASLATTTYLDAKDVPHMICHGSNDNIVPVCEAEKYRDNLEKAGIYVEWYNSDYGHEVVEDYTDEMISFFNKVRSGEVGQGGSSDSFDPCSYTTAYSDGSIIADNAVKDLENGYNVELWRETNTGSMTVFGGKADCAFKASWDNSGDFLARVGYYDGNASKEYTDLGEIYAVYNYSKKGDGGGKYSYIGVYGWTKNPTIEYYIVDDSFTPDGDGMFWDTETKGTYKVDGVEYTLKVGIRNNYPSILGNTSFKQVFAVRSSYQTCGSINVTEHFKNWENLGIKMGNIYDCKIHCEVGGGTGSIEYTCASMSWKGQNSSFGKLNSSNIDDPNIDDPGTPSDCVDPSTYTKKYSGGTTITSNCIRSVGNGYVVETWSEMNNGSATVFGDKADCAFKAEWDNSGDFLAQVGYYDAPATKTYTDLGEIYAVYNYSKTGDGGGIYSYIGIYGWTKNPLIEYYIVDDTFSPDGTGMFYGTEEIGTYKVDSVEYTLRIGQRIGAACIEGMADFQQIFAVRSSYQTCGKINVTEHFMNWEKLGVKMGNLYSCKIQCEVGGGTGSIEYTCASMSWKGQKSSLGKLNCDSTVKEEEIEKSDSINIYPCSYTTKYSGGTTITSNCLRDLGNGYNAEMWGERNNGSMTLFGGEAGCAFKAEWDNTGDFLARVGYYDAKASKKYTDLGEIYAIYNYIKSGDGGGSYSYIGVYGWTKNPMIEYYIVDDTFTPDSEDLFWGTNEIGTYKVDGVEYTLMVGQRINAPCIEGSASFKQIFAVRSSYQTCGIINVSEHFRNWEELGVKMGYIYDCKLLCEVGGGTGSIEYTCASMSWKGKKFTLGSLRNGEGDDTQITSAATYSDTKEFDIVPNPASTAIYIQSDGEIENVVIFNAIGDAVAESGESKIDVSTLPTGIYFVKATIDGETAVKKLVVTK
ncbi:MAG: glycoside hydrolase family 11 protein [Paludibacteraceae bacterium]|nr:glycoside hydrolase family 11 protein [Paludibacteraceae bacterium]